ncbi:MAG TPA: BtrH N-terminal domain-containing protein [candidate division Zixibacteria bacterium]|nr:BtrH N-terminal domain-containing protein [candidate division Zixibacteria bacterium]
MPIVDEKYEGKIAETEPFENCPCLDGYHCQTNSLAKIFHHSRNPVSEDTLLGLGAGMGFIYWHMKMNTGNYVFIGGRGNKNFFDDLAKRTGIKVTVKTTTSARTAETALLEKLVRREPVMMFGDMGFLPWFDLPEDYHFGGHTFVVCGFDGKNTVLASDIDQKAAGLKRGFYYPIALEQLRKARSSTYKPFPPKNAHLEFDFEGFHNPRPEDFLSSIRQTVESQLNPPIKNIGVKGLRHTAKEILKWPQIFKDRELRMNLFSLYIFIEIGGTGGGCFRYMYSRFLKEAAKSVGNKAFEEASVMFHQAGKKFTEIGLMFEDAETAQNINERIHVTSQKFQEIADIEENAYNRLASTSSE